MVHPVRGSLTPIEGTRVASPSGTTQKETWHRYGGRGHSPARKSSSEDIGWALRKTDSGSHRLLWDPYIVGLTGQNTGPSADTQARGKESRLCQDRQHEVSCRDMATAAVLNVASAQKVLPPKICSSDEEPEIGSPTFSHNAQHPVLPWARGSAQLTTSHHGHLLSPKSLYDPLFSRVALHMSSTCPVPSRATGRATREGCSSRVPVPP